MISIVIPTLNGAGPLPELLARLNDQKIGQETEILVIDSDSDDNTRHIATSHGARVVVIQRREFDHGGTRTMAIKLAAGEIVVFFTQDSLPADNHCLASLVQPLLADERFGVACGRQLPRPGATLFEAHLRQFNYPDKNRIRTFADRQQLGLKTIFVSNAFSAYRKKALAEVGYFGNNHIFGEDACAVGRMLVKGYRIIYVAEARVYHSHAYTLKQEFRRYFDIGVFHHQQHWLLETFGTAAGEGKQYVLSELAAIMQHKQYQLLPVSLVRNMMKFLGYHLGRRYQKLPTALIPRLSMNTGWWQRNTR